MIYSKEMEYIIIIMVINMMESGSKEKKTERVFFISMTVIDMMGNSKMIYLKEREYYITIMGMNIMEIG